MKTVKFLMAIVATMFFVEQTSAQDITPISGKFCKYPSNHTIVVPDPNKGEALIHTNDSTLLWIEMENASAHNAGGCFVVPYKQEVLVGPNYDIRNSGPCGNVITRSKWVDVRKGKPSTTTTPDGKKVTTTTLTPSNVTVVIDNSNRGSGSTSTDDQFAFTRQVNDEGIRMLKAYNGAQMELLETESDIRIKEKMADAALNKNNCCGGNSGGGNSGYSHAPTVIQTGGGGNSQGNLDAWVKTNTVANVGNFLTNLGFGIADRVTGGRGNNRQYVCNTNQGNTWGGGFEQVEQCGDGIDNDLDGFVDEGCPSPNPWTPPYN